MRSEGMAKEMPAATLSVLMPMTSPSWREIRAGGHGAALGRRGGPVISALLEKLRNGALGITSGSGTPTSPAPPFPESVCRGSLQPAPEKQHLRIEGIPGQHSEGPEPRRT